MDGRVVLVFGEIGCGLFGGGGGSGWWWKDVIVGVLTGLRFSAVFRTTVAERFGACDTPAATRGDAFVVVFVIFFVPLFLFLDVVFEDIAGPGCADSVERASNTLWFFLVLFLLSTFLTLRVVVYINDLFSVLATLSFIRPFPPVFGWRSSGTFL